MSLGGDHPEFARAFHFVLYIPLWRSTHSPVDLNSNLLSFDFSLLSFNYSLTLTCYPLALAYYPLTLASLNLYYYRLEGIYSNKVTKRSYS